MASNTIQFNQSNFNRGEIDSLLSARFDFEDYDKSLKRARNCITVPQGAIQRRFGTQLVAQYSTIANPSQIELSPILYNDDAVFLVVWYAGAFDVYIENTLFQSGTASGSPVYAAGDIPDLRFSQNGNNLAITNPNFPPRGLQLTPTNNTLTSVGANNFIASAASFPFPQIFPLTFLTSVPTATPPLFINRVYWGLSHSATSFFIFNSPDDAANGVNRYSAVASASAVVTSYNAWSIANLPIQIYPAYDFTSTSPSGPPYLAAGFTFTPSAVSGTIGSLVVITASGVVFTAAHVGGLFTGNGGILRITAFTDTTHVSGYTISPFAATTAIPGTLCFLGQPAWDAAHGFPRCSTTFQGRFFYSGSPAIPNGIWGSVVGEPSNFDDSESFPDNAISYYPGSGNVTYVQSMTAARSLLVHTNTGTFSTALSTEQPLTPANVSFTEQNKDGVGTLQPVFIDNQVVYIDSSLNNAKNLIWELSQSSYILRNISIVSSSLIRKPVDISNYTNPLYIDGSYVFIVNGDGTLATFNTLYMENVAGWTLQNTAQWTVGDGSQSVVNSFVHSASSFQRNWFIVQRIFYSQQASTTIASISTTSNWIVTTTSQPVMGNVWKCIFSGTPPVASPPIQVGQVYFALQTAATQFVIFPDYDSANNGINEVTLISYSGGGSVIMYEPITNYCLEELSFNAFLDSWAQGSISGNTFVFNNSALSTNYNGQWVYIYVDEGTQVLEDGSLVPVGYSLGPYQILNSNFGGLPISTASTAYIGFPFTTEIEFLPINLLLGTGANFYLNKSLRQFYLYYFETIGGEINGGSFAKIPLYQYPLGSPVTPQTGIVKMPSMKGWEPLNQSIVITQSEPFPLTILGYSASVELT